MVPSEVLLLGNPTHLQWYMNTARYDYSYYYYCSKTITARIARTKMRYILRSGNVFHFHPRDSNAEARQLTSRAVHDGIRDE